jgi:hypothetical protein
MYGIMLFIHLAGLAAWFGVTLMSAFLLLSEKRKLAGGGSAESAVSTIRIFNRITHPAAFLVLLSGGIMIMSWSRENMPFWLAFMERVGGMVILLFMIILSIMGGKLRKKLAAGDRIAASNSIGTYVTSIFVFSLLILAVIFVVSLKF